MTIETKSLSSSGIRTKSADTTQRHASVVNSVIDNSSFNAWRDTINYKAVAFESAATKDALVFEIQQKRAQWDPVAGQFRCPPETPAAGQFTNRLGEGCTTGFVRRLAARLGERLTGIGQGLGARRLDRGRDTELGIGAGARRTGAALEDWAQEGVDTPLMQARRARALARRGVLPSGAPSPRVNRRQRAQQLRQRMLDRVSRLRELGRRVDWGWNEDLDEQIRQRQGIPGSGAGGPPPPVPTPGVPGPTPTPQPGVPGPTPTPRPGVPGPTPTPRPGVPTPGRPRPGVPTPGRRPPRPSTSPTGGRAGYVAGLSRNKRVAWLITNGIDPDSGIAVHSPRNQDWIDLSNEIFPGVMPDGKTLKTMTGDELDDAYRAFMAIASDPNRTDDERVIAARMAGKIAGQSRQASRKWEEFNNEWDAAIAGARTEDERDALRAARDDAARELASRIGVYGSITRERRDRSQAKMPRQDAAPDDWYQYVNDITALSPVDQTQVNLPSPVQPDEGETDVPEAQAPPASPLMPSTPSPRQPRREDRRGDETVSAPQQPAATPDTATPETEPRAQGGRGTRTGSRGQQTTVVGGRSVADLTIEELLDQMERSDDQKERRAQAKKNRVPFNERIIKAPDGRATGKRLRKELGVPDPDKYLIDYTAEELDNLFEQMWNIMSDPAETMLRRRMARSVLRSIENDNERRTSRAGLTRGRRSIYPAGQFGFGYNYRDYVAPRRNNVWNDFVNLPAEEFQSKYGYTNTPMPPGWRPLTESEYGTARYVSPYLSRPENVSPDDPPAFSTGDDISLGTKEPSTEVGAVTGELVDELDATLSDAGFSDASKASAKADLVKHIERVARDQEEETGDISDEVRDAYGIARGKAEEYTRPTRIEEEGQNNFFENPPILYNGKPNPSYTNTNIQSSWITSFPDKRTSKRTQLESAYQNLINDGASQKEALQRVVEIGSEAIAWRKNRARAFRLDAALDTNDDSSAGTMQRALEMELDALALQYALDDFIENVSSTLSKETLDEMAEEVQQRAAWRAGEESLIEVFDSYPEYHSDSAAASEGRFAGLFDAITGLWTSISRSGDEDFWQNFGNFLPNIARAARQSSRPAERAALEKLHDGLVRLYADRDIDVLMTELWASLLSLTPQNEDFIGGLIPNRAGNVSPAAAFHYYHFDPITGGSNYFTSRAVGLQSEINIMKSRISDVLDTGQANPELAQILESMNGWTERFSNAAQAIVDDAKELDRDTVDVIREQIQGLRRVAAERQAGASSMSIAQWIDRNAHPLITDQSITIDDIGVSPRVGEEVRSNAQTFLDGLIHTMSGVEGPGIDGVVSVPKILQTGETDPALEDVVGFLREFDDPWFSQTLLDSIEGMRAEGDASIARIINGYVPPVNTGRVDIDSPDQLDTTPPTEEMGQRIRNLVRSVFAQRVDRQRGRFERMYPDTTPWNDPTLDDLFQRAVNGDFSARENIIGLAYTMPEFEVEIIDRDDNGAIIRGADGSPKKSKWLFRIDPDNINTDSAGASGYVQARRSDESNWVNIGHFQRFLQWSNGHVSHSHLYLGNQASSYITQRGQRLGDKLKASGFSETFNGHALRVLRRAGFKTAGVNAGWDGAYVWGRAGFRNGGNRTRMASEMRNEVAQWSRGRPSIVRSQDQANLWEYVARRLDETPDDTDPYDHIEAIVAIDDSATIADPDERKQRSAEIMRWFLNNATFSSGVLDIAEVYAADPPYASAQSIPTDINSTDAERLSSEAQTAYARLLFAMDRAPDYDGSLTQPGTERPSTLRPYYGVTRVDTGTNSTPTWETDGDPDINPVIADTSTGSGNSTAYVSDLIDALRESRNVDGNPFTRESLIELAEHFLSERSDRISTFTNQMRSDQREDAIATLRRLVNPETAEAWAIVSASSLDDILNPVLEPGFDNGTWGISTQLRTLGVVSDDVIRGSRPIRVGALSDSVENARAFADTYGSDRLQVVLRRTSADNPDIPTYYPTDARSSFDASGILYPNQELGPMGFHWDDIMYRDPLSPFTLYGFTRGQIRPENVAAIRMTQDTYDDLVASGRIADIPDSIQIQIIDGPNGLLNRQPDNSPNVGDAVDDLQETISNESSELAADAEDATLGDVFDRDREQAWSQYFDSPPDSRDAADRAARQRVQEAASQEQEDNIDVDTNLPDSPDVPSAEVAAGEAAAADIPEAPQTNAPEVAPTRERTGEAGGSDVNPRVQRAAARQEQEREVAPAEAPETPIASTESAPATPAPKKRQRSGGSTSGERNAQSENTASALDREITPVVGRYRVFRDENGEWTNPDAQTLEDNPDLYERETAEFLMEQANALRSQYRDTLRAIERDTEEMRATAESLSDSRGDVDPDEMGDAATSNVQIDQLRTNILQNQNLLQRIESAMDRIEDGTYGLSRGMTSRSVITPSAEASNRPIPAARLQAIPTANHRVDEAAPIDELASSAPSASAESTSPARAPRRRAAAAAAAAEDAGDTEDATPEVAPPPRADIGPDGMRSRNFSIGADPKALDRPIRVPDFSNYKLPYDPSKTYQRPVARSMNMMLDSLGMDVTPGNAREVEASLARAVRAAFDEPDWSDEYALGRMFNIVDEVTDYDLDEAQTQQSAEMMARVQEMITSMIDEQISTAEGLTRPGSRINIDMPGDTPESRRAAAAARVRTPIIRGLNRDRYTELLSRLRDPDGGFTYSVSEFDDVKTGWAIARKGAGIKFEASKIFSKDEAEVEDAIDRLEALLQLRREDFLEEGIEDGRVVALGAWHNPEDGQVYFDVVDVYSKDRFSLEEATAEGKNQNQIAITDLDNLHLSIADGNWDRNIFINTGGDGSSVTESGLYDKYLELIRAERLANNE